MILNIPKKETLLLFSAISMGWNADKSCTGRMSSRQSGSTQMNSERVEFSTRNILDLCQNWEFHQGFSPEDLTAPSEDFDRICLPHTVQELPYHYLNEKTYQIQSCYRRELVLDPSLRGQRLFLDFEGVMTACWVYVNGAELSFHRGGYTPFSVEITDAVSFEKSNRIVLHVDSTERKDTPPFGYVVDFLGFGGVYREVSLRAVPQTFIRSLFARPQQVLTGSPSLRVDGEFTVEASARLTLQLLDQEAVLGTVSADLNPGCAEASLTMENLTGIQLWTPDHPKRYTLEAQLITEAGEDRMAVKTGFRTAEFTEDGFLLNGRPFKLLGLNRHQQYPYAGYAMPWRAQQQDADILKKELGINLVHFIKSIVESVDCTFEIGGIAYIKVITCCL